MDDLDAPSVIHVEKEPKPIPHYYGDYVRRLFLVAGIIMLLALPFLYSNISIPILLSTFAILAITFLAGFTNPKQKKVAYFNAGASVVGFIVFEYYSVVAYSESGAISLFLFINQVLAMIFFFAMYLVA